MLLGLPFILIGVALDLAVRVIWLVISTISLLLASLIGGMCCLCFCDREHLDKLPVLIKDFVDVINSIPYMTSTCVRDVMNGE